MAEGLADGDPRSLQRPEVGALGSLRRAIRTTTRFNTDRDFSMRSRATAAVNTEIRTGAAGELSAIWA